MRMALQDVVELLVKYVRDEGKTLRDQYGPEAIAPAEDLADLVETRLEGKSAYVDLWDAFERAPNDTMEELTGALEAMIEADPLLARRMSAFVEEFREVTASEELQAGSSERYVAEEGGDALDTAVKPDLSKTPEDRKPYRPKTSGNVPYEDSVERGTYLYGNVKAGTDTVGQEAGIEDFDLEEQDVRPTRLAGVSGIPGLFEQLSTEVAHHPALDETEKGEVQTELQILQDQLQAPEAADPELLGQHLRTLRDRVPDVAEVVLQALAAFELPPSVEDAVEQVRLQPPEEG